MHNLATSIRIGAISALSCLSSCVGVAPSVVHGLGDTTANGALIPSKLVWEISSTQMANVFKAWREIGSAAKGAALAEFDIAYFDSPNGEAYISFSTGLRTVKDPDSDTITVRRSHIAFGVIVSDHDVRVVEGAGN